VNAIPDPYTDPEFASGALVIIDTQRDVLDGGPFEIAGTSAALVRMRELLDAFRAAKRPVVHVVRLYLPDGGNADLSRRRMLEDGAQLVLPGSPGSQIADDLLPGTDGLLDSRLLLDSQLLLAGGVQELGPREVAIYKPRWGAFYETPLEGYLRGQGISTLVFCGCNFPNCPRTSIYEASERDFRVVLARDAVSGLYERGERELERIGVRPLDSAEVVVALGDRRAPPTLATPSPAS